jgi:hypothetical protein
MNIVLPSMSRGLVAGLIGLLLVASPADAQNGNPLVARLAARRRSGRRARGGERRALHRGVS